MKKLLPIFIVAFALASCGSKWQEYHYGEPYNFNASFFKTPKIRVDSLANDGLKKYVRYSWENHFSDNDHHENSGYYIWINEIPQELLSSDSVALSPQYIIDAVAKARESEQMTLVSSNVEILNGHEGKTYRWIDRQTKTQLEERYYLADATLYRVAVETKEGKYPNQCASLFFNSFVLTGKPEGNDPVQESVQLTYTIDFPSAPQTMRRTADTEIGRITSNVSILEQTLDKENSIGYSVTEAKYGAEIAAKKESEKSEWYDAIIDGAAIPIGGIVISRKDVTIDGHTGKEARISFYEGAYTMVYRVVAVGEYLYIISVAAPSGVEDRQDIRLFINSFRIKE